MQNRHTQLLNTTFITDAVHTQCLEEALREIVRPAVADTDHSLWRLDRQQGKRPEADEPRSYALQCRFSTLRQVEEFRRGRLAEAIEQLQQKMPPQSCMVFQTHLSQMEF